MDEGNCLKFCHEFSPFANLLIKEPSFQVVSPQVLREVPLHSPCCIDQYPR